MFGHLLKLSHYEDSGRWPGVGFGEEMVQVELIEIHITRLIWSFENKSLS